MEFQNFNSKLVIDVVNEVLREYGLPALSKKATTHSGEYKSGCPRCKKLGQDAGTKHFMVWPERPILGGKYREEPIFYCRECYRDNDPARNWTGDLVQFLIDTMDLTQAEARKYLNVPGNYAEDTSRETRPIHKEDPAVPPPDLWRHEAAEVVEACVETLWGKEGVPALKYLMEERGFTEDIIWKLRYGYQPAYNIRDAGKAWGLEDEYIAIPRGIVIPEYHYDHSSKQNVLWSVCVRRSDRDLLDALLETGENLAKYHTLRGGSKGMYLIDTVYEQDILRPCILVEGPFDAASALQTTQGKFAVASTQSTTGARNLYWRTKLLDDTSFVLIATDNEESGKEAAKYWRNVLGDQAVVHFPALKDLNKMLTEKQDILAWAMQGAEKYRKKLYQNSTLPLQEAQETPQNSGVGTTTSPDVEIAPIVITEPNNAICGVTDEVKNERVSLEERCQACERGYKYVDVLENKWCGVHFAAVILIEWQQKNNFAAYTYPEGYGLVKMEWQFCEGGRVQPGQAGVINFIRMHEPAEIWLAARHARDIVQGFIQPEKNSVFAPPPVIIYPCSNTLCKQDASKPFYPYNVAGSYQVPTGPCYNGVITWQDTEDMLRWCPRCLACHYTLLLAEYWGFPELKGYTGQDIGMGKGAWVTFVRENRLFDVAYTWQMLKEISVPFAHLLAVYPQVMIQLCLALLRENNHV